MTDVGTGTMIGIGTGIGTGIVTGIVRGTATEIGPGKETVETAIERKETTELRPEKTAETRDTKAIRLAIEVLKRTLVNMQRTIKKPVYILFLTRPLFDIQKVCFRRLSRENTLIV